MHRWEVHPSPSPHGEEPVPEGFLYELWLGQCPLSSVSQQAGERKLQHRRGVHGVHGGLIPQVMWQIGGRIILILPIGVWVWMDQAPNSFFMPLKRLKKNSR